MSAKRERYIILSKKTPVYIAYFTAFIDSENRMNFRKDIYNRDGKLSKMLIEGESSLSYHLLAFLKLLLNAQLKMRMTRILYILEA